MRIARVLLFATAALAYQAACAVDEYVRNESCDKSQRTLNECASEEHKFYDSQLNSLYNQKLLTIEDKESKERFKDAQRKWLKYRDAECHFSAGPYNPHASIWPMQNDMCLAQLTKERATHLEFWVNCTDNGCP